MLVDNVFMYEFLSTGLIVATILLVGVALVASFVLVPVLGPVWLLVAAVIVAFGADTLRPMRWNLEKTFTPIAWQEKCMRGDRHKLCFDDIDKKKDEIDHKVFLAFNSTCNSYMNIKNIRCGNPDRNTELAENAERAINGAYEYLNEQATLPEPLRKLDKADEFINKFRRN